MKKECYTCKYYEDCRGDDCLYGDPPTRWEPAEHYKPDTNADRIRAMSDEELSDFLCGIAYAGSEKWSEPFMREFCDKCPTVEGIVTETGQKLNFYECDFKDGKCPHGSDISWWLKQPAEVDHE